MSSPEEFSRNLVAASTAKADELATLTAQRDEAVKALENLCDTVGAMKVPQNIAQAGLQIGVTIGPAYKSARVTIARIKTSS